MTTDIASIAAGLSEAQRRAILWCNLDGSPKQHCKAAPSRASFWALKSVVKGDPRKMVARHYKLIDQGEGEKPRGRIWPESTWALTPLGLALRTHLLEKCS